MDATGPPSTLQRATGDLRIGFKRRDHTTSLASLAQGGCLRARLPRRQHDDWAEIIQLNNAGGVAGGDRLTTRLHLAPATRALFTTASAERIYRRADASPAATIRNHIVLEVGAAMEWLPQETIVFDGSAMDRTLDIDLADCASLLATETIIFGRQAMGETVLAASIRDTIRIRRAGSLILHDALRPPPAIAEALSRLACGNGARAMATLIHAAPHAPAAIEAVRATLAAHDTVEAGVSGWDGMLVARLISPTPSALRAALTAVLHRLRDGRMLPRAWTC